jgi:Cu(I)/Ag(I) efflux system membrane fusion protein
MKTKHTRLWIIAAVCLLAVAAGYGYRHWHGGGSKPNAATGLVQYTCPMHPFIVRDQPGICPICRMELIRKGPGESDSGTGTMPFKEHVYLSSDQQVMANVELTSVMYKPLFKIIDAAGIITYDQTRQGKVSAWVAGRIERLHADTVGTAVTKERPVAELNSPELTTAEEEYLVFYRQALHAGRGSRPEDADTPLRRADRRLRRLGFMDAQFRELEKTGAAHVRIPLYPPISGIVTANQVQEGQYVQAGDLLMSVADLSRIWAELDVYEDEFPFLKTGQDVGLTTRAYPGKEFKGRITFLAPFLDPKTRTVRVRVTIPNHELLLKPEMMVQATIQIPLGTDMAVPAEAVVVTGRRTVVWALDRPGVFVPREVKTGVRYRNDIQILDGLKKDDLVAASGAYLIDAEAQFQTAGGRNDEASKPAPAASAPREAAISPGGKAPAAAGSKVGAGDEKKTAGPTTGAVRGKGEPEGR